MFGFKILGPYSLRSLSSFSRSSGICLPSSAGAVRANDWRIHHRDWQEKGFFREDVIKAEDL